LVQQDNSSVWARLSVTLIDPKNNDPQTGEIITLFNDGVSDAYMINKDSCVHNPAFGSSINCGEWIYIATGNNYAHYHQNCHFISDPNTGGLSQEVYIDIRSDTMYRIMGNVSAGSVNLYTFDVGMLASEIDGPHERDFDLPQNCHKIKRYDEDSF